MDRPEPYHRKQDIAVNDEVLVEMEGIVIGAVGVGEYVGCGRAQALKIEKVPYAAAFRRVEGDREP